MKKHKLIGKGWSVESGLRKSVDLELEEDSYACTFLGSACLLSSSSGLVWRHRASQHEEQAKVSQSDTTLQKPPLVLLSYHEAPAYLQFNPYITKGYRGYLSTKMCIESMFWMTNETINIWSHIFGWMLFLGLTLYDLCLVNIQASLTDKFIVGLLLASFQICMVMSALYHIFSCRSEEHFHSFLCFDLFGIALSMLGIYMTGVYYAYWCHRGWQMFYLSTVFIIFVIAMVIQLPRFQVDADVKLLTFVGWAAYGVIPTIHWTFKMGGLESPIVALLLPRVIMMYFIIGLAFTIYITKIPERFFKGYVDFVGSSHQWWHFFVVVALYYWHNTGIKYIEYRINHGCLFDLRTE